MKPDSPSNLVILMSDEHQARALSCAGHPLVKTPNLDRLAKRGVRFTNAYTPSPICVPARASFATGKYVHQTRLWDNAMPYDGRISGWGHALQAKGIPVESVGKLHYRSQEDQAGFDVEHIPMMVAGGVGMVWASIRKEDERVNGKGRMLGDVIGPGHSKYTEYDASVTKTTVNWIKERGQMGTAQPWCLYAGLVAPHFPLIVPQEFYDLYDPTEMPDPKLHPRDGHLRHPWVEKQNAIMDSEAQFSDDDERRRAIATYFGLCSWLDHNIGQILDALDDAGLTESTTVVYTSDHGDNLGERGLWGKSTLYQESTAIPMIMAGPHIDTGICETPVSLVDLSKTIAQHFNADFNATKGAQSLSDILANPDNLERPVFSEYHAAGAVSGAYMLRVGRWKLHYYVGFDPELFDLDEDPEEVHNLTYDPEYADRLKAMKTRLRHFIDPEETDKLAFADQENLITLRGGREHALTLGAPGATPPPATE